MLGVVYIYRVTGVKIGSIPILSTHYSNPKKLYFLGFILD